MKTEKKKEPKVRGIGPYKLKNHPENRRSIVINLKREFGFLPEVIIIAKDPKSNNKFAVIAVLPEKEVKKEEALEKAKLRFVLKDAKRRKEQNELEKSKRK
jgi:hypothetical protein